MGNDKLGNTTPATSVLCLPIIVHFGPGKSPEAISSYSRTSRTADMKVQAYTIVVKEIGCEKWCLYTVLFCGFAFDGRLLFDWPFISGVGLTLKFRVLFDYRIQQAKNDSPAYHPLFSAEL